MLNVLKVPPGASSTAMSDRNVALRAARKSQAPWMSRTRSASEEMPSGWILRKRAARESFRSGLETRTRICPAPKTDATSPPFSIFEAEARATSEKPSPA